MRVQTTRAMTMSVMKFFAGALLVLLAPAASAAETKITKHFFEYGTLKYFRGKAENVEMCSYGEKKDPIGPDAYLAIQSKVERKHLAGRVRYITTASITWSQQSKTEVEVNGGLRYFGLGAEGSIGGSYEKAKSANLKLVKFAIDEGPLKTLLNTDANGARNYLADEGNDGRIVSEIWVVVEAELAEHFASSTSVSASASGDGKSLSMKASGGKHGSQTITMSAGTTFAYLMHSVKKWGNGKDKIEDLEDDSKGMN